ncbi:MAG: hypothetical protein LC800_17785 [Acidobacteria bacterium]|nr:hypothetical protein [Acidobacteriota bacterium]
MRNAPNRTGGALVENWAARAEASCLTRACPPPLWPAPPFVAESFAASFAFPAVAAAAAVFATAVFAPGVLTSAFDSDSFAPSAASAAPCPRWRKKTKAPPAVIRNTTSATAVVVEPPAGVPTAMPVCRASAGEAAG